MIDVVHENRFLSRWAELLPRAPGQIGRIHETDAELVPFGDGKLLAVTVDTVAEEIAAGLYRRPRTAGRMAATSSLSDLAAVGAEPIGLLNSVTLPSADADGLQAQVAEGFAEICGLANTYVLGGDTNEGPALAVTCIAIGYVPQGEALTRVGAKPGDLIFASGTLGMGGAMAASALLGLGSLAEDDFRPPLRLAAGTALRGIASACIDTSDGLVSALDQLARINGARFRVDAPPQAILNDAARQVRAQTGLPWFPFLASHHGEYELLFTVPEAELGRLGAAAKHLEWSPLELGRVEAGDGIMFGDTPVDGARVRNLFADAAGDIGRYLGELCSIEI